MLRKMYGIPALSALGLTLGIGLLTGCAMPAHQTSAPVLPTITTVTPAASGYPNSVITFGKFEFVSVQGTGQIFTYDISSGSQVQIGEPYATPCSDPSGMVVTTIDSTIVLAAVCYDTGSLLTLTVHANGSLSSLGSVGGLALPYPGIALGGTNLYIPLFGQSLATNGAVAKVSIANPALPVVTAITTLASPVPGGCANPPALTVSGGYIYIAAGSESYPQTLSSTIQVLNEQTMALIGTPFVIPHSPQQIAVSGTTAYVTLYDAAQIVSIDVTDPATPHILQSFVLGTPTQACNPIPVVVTGTTAYVGCYAQGGILQLDIANPANMQVTHMVPSVNFPQQIVPWNSYLLVPDSNIGGNLYQISASEF